METIHPPLTHNNLIFVKDTRYLESKGPSIFPLN